MATSEGAQPASGPKTRQNGKATAELSDGRCLPVSRGFLAQVKQAGLIA